MGTRRKFTDEFKREAVKLATKPGVPMTKVAALLRFRHRLTRADDPNHRAGSRVEDADVDHHARTL